MYDFYFFMIILLGLSYVRTGGVKGPQSSNACIQLPQLEQSLNCQCNLLGQRCADPNSICEPPPVSGSKGSCQCKSGFTDEGGKCEGTCTIAPSSSYFSIECVPDGTNLCGAYIIAGPGCTGGLKFTVTILYDYHCDATNTVIYPLTGINSTSANGLYPIYMQKGAQYYALACGDTPDVQCFKVIATDAAGKTATTTYCVSGNIYSAYSGDDWCQGLLQPAVSCAKNLDVAFNTAGCTSINYG